MTETERRKTERESERMKKDKEGKDKENEGYTKILRAMCWPSDPALVLCSYIRAEESEKKSETDSGQVVTRVHYNLEKLTAHV